MYVVRDTFRTKPGKANALIEKFTAAAPHLAGAGVKGHRILVDEVADYWTVDFESTVEDLESYFAFRENTAGGGGGGPCQGTWTSSRVVVVGSTESLTKRDRPTGCLARYTRRGGDYI